MEWICRAEDLVLAEERTTEDDRKLIMEARQKAAEKMKKLSRTKTDSVESNSMEDGGEGGSMNMYNEKTWLAQKITFAMHNTLGHKVHRRGPCPKVSFFCSHIT